MALLPAPAFLLPAGLPVAVRLAVEKLDALRLDFRDETVLPLLILPLAGFELAFDEDEAALAEVLRTVFRRLLEHDDAVPLGLFDLLPAVVRVGFVRGDAERADGAAALGIFQLGIASEATDDHHFVEAHGFSCWRDKRKPRPMVGRGTDYAARVWPASICFRRARKTSRMAAISGWFSGTARRLLPRTGP